MGYLLPTEDLAPGATAEFRRKAVNASIARAISKKIGTGVRDASGDWQSTDLIVREAQNNADFGTALDQWNTAALAVVGTNYSVFQAIAAPRLAITQVAVFYKVVVETIPMPVSRLSFRKSAAAGTTIDIFDLEVLGSKDVPEGYFSEAVVYDPNTVLNVVVMARIATGVLAQVQLGCFICEPSQDTLS